MGDAPTSGVLGAWAAKQILMQTIEVSFVNRRKEKITADAINFTDAPGWLVIKVGGTVAEMIPATVVKRLKFLPTDTVELVAPAPTPAPQVPVTTPLLRLPTRRELMGARHVYSPLLTQSR